MVTCASIVAKQPFATVNRCGPVRRSRPIGGEHGPIVRSRPIGGEHGPIVGSSCPIGIWSHYVHWNKKQLDKSLHSKLIIKYLVLMMMNLAFL